MIKKEISEIKIKYEFEDKEKIQIFGSEFVKNNKKICKMIINNIEYELRENCNVENNFRNKLEIKLKGINNITNMSYMFDGCSPLISLSDISNWNTNNVIYMNNMFDKCSSLDTIT